MAIKGHKFKSYSEELKLEAIRLYVEEKWTYRQINAHLGIQDQTRMKKWMRKYREQGEFGLLDQRGRRTEYLDQDRYEGKYGYRQRQLFLWQDDGVWMNQKKVLRLMQILGLQARIRRKQRLSMTYQAAERVVENRLERNFTAEKPNQKWVTDVTQYRVGERWLYLSAVKDLFNNEIVAYQLGERNDNELVLQTFANAFAKQKDVTGLVVHSDQGFQYTSHAYHDMLPKVNAQISVSRRGNCLDNASMESFFSPLKTEGLYPYNIRNWAEAQSRIEKYIRFYNRKRPQRK